MLSWWCVDLMSRALAPEEREVVRGDIAESGATSGRALRDVLGLAIRQQAMLWKQWKPWVVFLCLVLPLTVVLLSMSMRTTGRTAVYSWLYLNNWTTGYLAAGFRQDLLHDLVFFGLSYFKLIFAAWSAGFAIGFVSRKAICVHGLLFFLLLLPGVLLTASKYRGLNGPVFALNFYRLILPFLVVTVLVLIPALRGMHDGLRFSRRFTT